MNDKSNTPDVRLREALVTARDGCHEVVTNGEWSEDGESWTISKEVYAMAQDGDEAAHAALSTTGKVLVDVNSLNREVPMLQAIKSEHRVDENGNPAGGDTTGKGIVIQWQDGPLGRGAERKEPNGAFVEGVIAAAISRIEFYQSTKFKCRENAIALTHLETALLWLQKRTMDREARDVEGTHAQ